MMTFIMHNAPPLTPKAYLYLPINVPNLRIMVPLSSVALLLSLVPRRSHLHQKILPSSSLTLDHFQIIGSRQLNGTSTIARSMVTNFYMSLSPITCHYKDEPLASAWCKVMAMEDRPTAHVFYYMDSDAIVDKAFENMSLKDITLSMKKKLNWIKKPARPPQRTSGAHRSNRELTLVTAGHGDFVFGFVCLFVCLFIFLYLSGVCGDFSKMF